MASLMMNGSMRSPSSLSDVSEESFVVLCRHVDGENLEQGPSADSLLSNSIVCPTIPNVPVTDSVSQSTSIMSASATSELSAEEIQSKLESLLQENLQLKATLQQNNMAMKKQFSTLVMWQEDVMKVHQSHKEKFEETKKLITNLRAENAELRKATSLPCSSSTERPEDETLPLKAKISALEFELDTLRQANIRFKNEQSKIVQELELKLSESEKGRAEEVNNLNLQVDSLNKQVQAVEQRYEAVQAQLEASEARVPSQADLEQHEQERTQLKELSAELTLKNKLLKDKTELIDTLHEQIARLKGDNETIPILMRQVEIYKQDFNQEREARNGLKSERDRLAEDLRHLQRRNNQLLEEVERLRPPSFVYVPSAPTSQQQQQQQQASREQTPPLQQYICPVCDARYRSLRALEEHVNSCIQD